jgi:spindle assembly abnormal protein 6
VQITNELDPFFFYSLEVNEDDFQSLKVEQCILVDFATFPHKFIELLEQCIVSSSTDNPRCAMHPSLSFPNIMSAYALNFTDLL